MPGVIALDLDDVVFAHVEGFCSWSNQAYGTSLTPDEYTEAWHELWGILPEEVEARKKLFFTDEIVGAFEIIEGAPEGLSALSQSHTVIGVTSRRESLQDITQAALEEVAPGAVSAVIFATFFQDGQKFTRSKGEICVEIAATCLIDDHLKHCLAVQAVGVKAILFGSYPWNHSDEKLPPGVERASDWSEVLKILGVTN